MSLMFQLSVGAKIMLLLNISDMAHVGSDPNAPISCHSNLFCPSKDGGEGGPIS
jgi:hypothetical protein